MSILNILFCLLISGLLFATYVYNKKCDEVYQSGWAGTVLDVTDIFQEGDPVRKVRVDAYYSMDNSRLVYLYVRIDNDISTIVASIKPDYSKTPGILPPRESFEELAYLHAREWARLTGNARYRKEKSGERIKVSFGEVQRYFTRIKKGC